MRILFINSVCDTGSTGRICIDLAQQLEAKGNEVKIAYGRKECASQEFEKYAVRIGTDLECKIHALQTRLFDTHGFGSIRATERFLEWAEAYKPDLLWLHNIHGYYINIEKLFRWIKQHPEMQVKWTLHDCWAFTGHCSHFTIVQCDQWKKQCVKCAQIRQYPSCYLMSSVSKNFERKKKAFIGVKNLTLITPSRWLADLTRESFLKEYPVEVHYNTVNSAVFKPRLSNFRDKYGVKDKFIILGVANVWEKRKGIDDFFKLAELLGNDFVIVLVGLNKKQMKRTNRNIVTIQHTTSPEALAEIYTAADVFFNPTYEDNYPTVNLEAEACGTPVITYATGGAPETIKRADSVTVRVGDIERVVRLIHEKCN